MPTTAAYLLTGLAAGFTSALLGIGGGVVMVPMLILLFELEPRIATATSLGYIAPVALVGALLAWRHGDVPQLNLILLAAPAGLAGAFIGRWASLHVSGAHLKVLFALLLLVVGIRLGVAGWRDLRAGPTAGTAPAQSSEADPL